MPEIMLKLLSAIELVVGFDLISALLLPFINKGNQWNYLKAELYFQLTSGKTERLFFVCLYLFDLNHNM